MSNQPQDYSPAWPGPSLLVPMTADCLLVGEPDRAVITTPLGISSSWAQTGTNYQNLLFRLTPDTAPPFTTKTTSDQIPGAGAHIIWTLPYALRHGEQSANGGEVIFPPAPNRWAVLRLQYDTPGAAPVLTAGIIESDKLSALPNTLPIGQYPNPSNPNAVQRIGGYVKLSDWNGPAGPATPFVKVVGPGDVSWAVAYDNIRNVFSFYDQLPDQKATLTYCIVGWYARPANDPLYGAPGDDPAAWLSKLATFNWDVGGSPQDLTAAQAAWTAWQQSRGLGTGSTDGLPPQLQQAIQGWKTWQTAHGESGSVGTLPRQLICHATIAQVNWQGTKTTYGTGAPGGGMQFPSVSIGNTATEAIAAWFADYIVRKQQGNPDTIPDIERAIEAFQKNALLELENDPVSAEFMLHRARFGSADGGKEWIVVRPESVEGQPNEFGGQQTVPLNVDQTRALTQLNTLQTSADLKRAQLYTQRLELFLSHYKFMTLGKSSPKDIFAQVKQARDTILAAAQATANDLKQYAGSIDAAAAALRQQVGADFVVLLVDRPAFYAPTDPVLMVAAVQQDTKFAPPGTYGDDESLFTRFTGQTVTGLDVEVGGVTVSLDAADLLKALTLPQGAGIPKELPDLWLEAVWLDPSSAPLLARLASQKAAPPGIDAGVAAQVIAAQQTILYNNKDALGVDEKSLGVAARLHGVPPANVALNLRLNQPWTPIFMDWKVSWCPSWSGPSDTLAGKGWKLGDNDYNWGGQSVSLPPAKLIFTGRTVLNPKIAHDIAERLSLFQDDPDYSSLPINIRNALTDLTHEIGKFDIMTQSLGGFSERLMTQLVASNKAPEDATVAAALGSDPVTFRPVFDDVRSPKTLPFFPVRAGHLQVLDLWVVDSWGQILRGKDPTLGADSPLPNLLRAESVTTAGAQNKTFVQLPPRVTQPARVELLMLQADNDSVRSNSSDLTSPICGWVMPNHLDDSLMVFSAAGDGLGTLLKVQTDRTTQNPQGSGVRWDAVPGSDARLGAPPSLPNKHLQAFVDALLNRSLLDGGAGFDALISAIDSSLWTVGQSAAQEGNLSVLLGRPLAVVRADVSLNLYGQPVYNQSWLETGKFYVGDGGAYKPLPVPFQTVEFYARVGDLSLRTNGVLGYFLDDDYSRFNSVYGSGTQTVQLRAALRRPGGRASELLNALTSSTLLGEAQGSAGEGYVQFGSLVELPPDGSKSKLTLLMDPRGVVPVITGSLPVETVALAPGPATEALRRMKAHFRVGPVLTDPSTIRMPLPGEIRGQWAWMARTDVTTWSGEQPVQTQSPILRLESTPLRLGEGWLILSGAEQGK